MHRRIRLNVNTTISVCPRMGTKIKIKIFKKRPEPFFFPFPSPTSSWRTHGGEEYDRRKKYFFHSHTPWIAPGKEVNSKPSREQRCTSHMNNGRSWTSPPLYKFTSTSGTCVTLVHDYEIQLTSYEFQHRLKCRIEDVPRTSRNPQPNAICELCTGWVRLWLATNTLMRPEVGWPQDTHDSLRRIVFETKQNDDDMIT